MKRPLARPGSNVVAPVARMRARDAIEEALSAPLSRPGRALLTALGTILGVGLFVLTLGLTASTGAAVNADFDALISTEVDVTGTPAASLLVATPSSTARALRLRGVLAIGPLLDAPSNASVTRYPANVGSGSPSTQISVLAASAGALGVIEPTLQRGRPFDKNQESRDAHVALVGSAAADILGMQNAPLPWWVSIDGNPFLVDGVIGHTARHAEALLSVMIPYATALTLPSVFPQPTPTLIVATKLGYTDAVTASLPTQLNPRNPTEISASSLPQPTLLRRQISGNLTDLFVLLAAVGMVVGTIGITNSAVVSVMERTSEIGVRRALGARKAQIASQFLLENLVIGTIGGILGVCAGVTALAAVTLAKGWTPVLPVWVVVVAPAAGSVTGLLAGVYPAMRAASADPVHALAR